MSRRLLLTASTGALLLLAAPALAAPSARPAGGWQGVDDGQRGAEDSPSTGAALVLLNNAARAGRQLAFSGMQYSAAGSEVADATQIEHEPGARPVLTVSPAVVPLRAPAPVPAVTGSLDPTRLQVLARAYDLVIAGADSCAGRVARVVEARRAGHVAGRFWIDHDTGLLLRRETYDDVGRAVRSSSLVTLSVRPQTTRQDDDAGPDPDVETEVEAPPALPGGLALIASRAAAPTLRQLSYTDGLSTLALFVQDGGLDRATLAGYRTELIGGAPVSVRDGAPERVVWSGHGHVYTLVSDAPAGMVHRAVAALPRDASPATGLRSRLGRGLSRLGGWLDPFG